ncbi:MAG: T9SS type A sorting domain-containing protein [Prolixibacteraceae bacterium]|nr:T9SS type A sorting domain-containing protein [Prolixibacteraceae bacterium]
MSVAQTDFWQEGQLGGEITWAQFYNNKIYCSRNSNLLEVSEGETNIQVKNTYPIAGQISAFSIRNDTLIAIHAVYSEFSNRITKAPMADLSQQVSVEVPGMNEGALKFKEVDGYIFLGAHKFTSLGGRTYVASKLVGFDLLNSTNPGFEYVQEFKDFVATSNYVYLLVNAKTDSSRIEVIDVRDKSNVTKVAEINVSNGSAVELRNDHIFVSGIDANKSIHVINISNPLLPQVVSTFGDNFATYEQILIDGDFAYFAPWGKYLDIFDISDPANIQRIDSGELTDFEYFELRGTNGVDKACYVSSGKFGLIDIKPNIKPGKKYLMPHPPRKVRSNGENLIISGYGYFYLATLYPDEQIEIMSEIKKPEGLNETDLYFEGNYLFAWDYGKLYIFDVNSPGSEPISYTSAGPIMSHTIQGNLAVVSGSLSVGANSYIELIDLSNKTTPQQQKLINIDRSAKQTALNDEGTLLYTLYDVNGKLHFRNFDLNDISNPVELCDIEIETNGISEPVLSIDDTVAYIATQSSGSNAVLHAFNIVDPSVPTLKHTHIVAENKYHTVKFIEEVAFLSVPEQLKLYMCEYNTETGFETIKSIDTEVEARDLSAFLINETVSSQESLNTKSAISDTKESFVEIYGWLFTTLQSNAFKYKFKKKKRISNDVILQTSVKPNEAAKDGCKITGGGMYKKGATAKVNASSGKGWVKDKYTGALTGKIELRQLVMDDHKEVTAHFQPILTIGLSSNGEENIAPPKNDEEVNMCTVTFTADGVDWELNGISFDMDTAKAKLIKEPTRVLLKIDGENHDGEIHTDSKGYIASIDFFFHKKLPGGIPVKGDVIFKFDFKPHKYGLVAPLNEVYRIGLSTSKNKVYAQPIPEEARPGRKFPEDELFTHTKTVASVWNVSTSPYSPFLNVHDAINSNITKDGHRIEVWEGYYNCDSIESSDRYIFKNIKIVGVGKRDSIIIKANNKEVFDIYKGDVLISNLTFTTTYSTTIIDYNGPESSKMVEISQNSFHATFGSSSSEWNSLIKLGKAPASIKNNEFTCSYDKTILARFSGKGSIFWGNKSVRGNGKIVANGGEDMQIQKNELGRIECNSGTGYNIAENIVKEICIGYCDSICLDSNIMHDSASDAILVDNSRHTVITKNRIIEAKRMGIVVKKSTDSYIYKNNIYNSGSHGISLEGNNNSYGKTQYTRPEGMDIITDNKVIGSSKIGIYGYEVNTIHLIDNEVALSGDGIYVTRANDVIILDNVIRHNSSGITVNGTKKCLVSYNKIKDNGDSGIYLKEVFLSDKKGGEIIGNIITEHYKTHKNGDYKFGNGVSIYNCSGLFNIFNNKFIDNCRGIRIEGSGKRIRTQMKGNIYKYAICENTGVHLDNVEADFETNHFSHNNGAALALYGNATATVKHNNIFDNPDLAIANHNPNFTVNANSNYWGGEPTSSNFSGKVNWENWMTKAISLNLTYLNDTVFVPIGSADSTYIAVNNFTETDRVTVNVADQLDWVEKDTITSMLLQDTAHATMVLKIDVPDGVPAKQIDVVKVHVSSEVTSNTLVDSFYVMSYLPELTSFTLQPDSISVLVSDTLVLGATAYDQYGNEFDDVSKLGWSVSDGEIDTSGIFIAPANEVIVTVEIKDTTQNKSVYSYINVVNDFTPHRVEISPKIASILPGSFIHFSATAFHSNGFKLPINGIWESNGGDIGQDGHLMATDLPGDYYVRLTDSSGIVLDEINFEIIVTNIGLLQENINKVELKQNYPNPFRSSTTIDFTVPQKHNGKFIRLRIFNLMGKEIKVLVNERLEYRKYSIEFKPGTIPDGFYIYRLDVGNKFISRKMLLIKQ